MKATFIIVLAVLFLCPARAQRRTYDRPRVTDYTVDNCLYFGKVCGKPAADAFCDRKGYRESDGFRTAPARPTMVMGEERVCDEDYCVGLFDVVCVGTANSYDSKRLDSEFPLELNTDRYGGDYYDFGLPEAHPELCRRACARDSTCRAFTYVKPGTLHGNSAWCYLKNSAPPTSRQDCCVSGVKK